MSNNWRRIPRQVRGAPILASTLASMADSINRERRPIESRQRSALAQASPLSIRRATLVQVVSVDLLLLRTVGLSPLTFYAAKPVLLRSSNTSRRTSAIGGGSKFVRFSGYTDNERTATDGSTIELQGLVPAYLIGDQIFAHGPVETGLTQPDGSAVEWIDANYDARNFAAELP